jgi:putative transposase
MCRLLGVGRSAYYENVLRKVNQSDDSTHEKLIDVVREIAKSSNFTYGSRRMEKALNALSYPVGRWKARSLMKEAGVQVGYRKKYKVTTNSNHKQSIYENQLNRQFDVTSPNQANAGDIMYRAPVLRRCH